jgi:8-oxo-dGTP pyrophosphatase MutT (NUDIX family)
LQTALRESGEEVGISGIDFRLASVDTHFDQPRSKTYRVYTLIARPVGEARLMEDRHSAMAWLDPTKLPEDVFETRPGLLQALVEQILRFQSESTNP